MPQEPLAPHAPSGYVAPDVAGNIQWYNRPEVDTSSIRPGTTGTVYSSSREENGYEVLFPQIYSGKSIHETPMQLTKLLTLMEINIMKMHSPVSTEHLEEE